MGNAKIFFVVRTNHNIKQAGVYLVFRSSNGLREAKERQGQVHEAVFVRLQLLMSLDNLDELQAYQAHHRSRGGSDCRNDLASYQFALEGMKMNNRGKNYLNTFN